MRPTPDTVRTSLELDGARYDTWSPEESAWSMRIDLERGPWARVVLHYDARRGRYDLGALDPEMRALTRTGTTRSTAQLVEHIESLLRREPCACG